MPIPLQNQQPLFILQHYIHTTAKVKLNSCMARYFVHKSTFSKHTHTHTHISILQPSRLRMGLPGVSEYQNQSGILLKQETVSGSGISCAICKSASRPRQTDNHASIPQLSFLQARCPSCRPTNSVKALKESMFF